MVMKHELCECGHEKELHGDDKKGCMWCTCQEYVLDVNDFSIYITNEICRRAKQIDDLSMYSYEVLREHQNTLDDTEEIE